MQIFETWDMPLEGMKLAFIQDSGDEMVIGLETENKPIRCPRCQALKTVGFGRMILRVRDKSIGERKVYLDIKRRRLRCQNCLATFNEPLGGVSENHRATERHVESIGKLALKLPFTVLSRQTGMDEKTVRSIFNDFLKSLKDSSRPVCSGSVVLWLPLILRSRRSVWVNRQECTLVAMDADAKPATIRDALKQFLESGHVKIIYVPPDESIIRVIQETTDAKLILHAASLKTECARVVESVRDNDAATRYAQAVRNFLEARSEAQALSRWQDLAEPPPGFRTKMRPLILAVDLIGSGAFGAFRDQVAVCDAHIVQLERLLVAGFSRRSYDVVHAVMMFDKYLHKTKRTSTESTIPSAVLDYKKIDFGTAIPKLISRLKDMVEDSKNEE